MVFLQAFGAGCWATGLGHEARAFACYDNKNTYLQALLETGATGLEPATSGVTGRASVATILQPATVWAPLA
jgi:hypothetical protein